MFLFLFYFSFYSFSPKSSPNLSFEPLLGAIRVLSLPLETFDLCILGMNSLLCTLLNLAARNAVGGFKSRMLCGSRPCDLATHLSSPHSSSHPSQTPPVQIPPLQIPLLHKSLPNSAVSFPHLLC